MLVLITTRMGDGYVRCEVDVLQGCYVAIAAENKLGSSSVARTSQSPSTAGGRCSEEPISPYRQ
jgi:hypothetical protein